MLIQELARQDRIQHSVGVKLVGSRLDRVDLEVRRLRFVFQFSLCRSCVKIDSVDMLNFTHTGFNMFGFSFTQLWILCQKHRYIYLYMYIGFYPYTICFKIVSISCFYSYISLQKNCIFLQKFGFQKNTVFVLRQNFKDTKMVQIV